MEPDVRVTLDPLTLWPDTIKANVYEEKGKYAL